MQAILHAQKLIDDGEIDLLVLSGEEPLVSKWGHRKEERQRFMDIYGEGKSPFTEYNKVAAAFCAGFGLTQSEFHKAADLLFKNYLQTWTRRNPGTALPSQKWFEFVSDYFRGVDCANPNTDFAGAIVIASSKTAERLENQAHDRFPILACSLNQLGEDGPEHISDFIRYDHIAKSFDDACQQSHLDFKKEFLEGNGLLEIYTCYPVVALAFLLKNKFVDPIANLGPFLSNHEITYTGGLNLNRAPWNCTTLNHIIAGLEIMRADSSKKYLGVHGNSSLGYQQAFLILGRR